MADWQPTAALPSLKKRAAVMSQIRQFFDKRHVLEVETPLLSMASVTDPHLQSFRTEFSFPGGHQKKSLYLQTSPEYAMKRLLAFGSGPIYQMTKAFRNEESGRMHNPEFSMLEWYRPGFDHHGLMDEMDEFLQTLALTNPAHRFTYQAVFEKYLDINPHEASISQLSKRAVEMQIHMDFNAEDALIKDNWLHLLMSHCIEPQLGLDAPVFIYDYPKSQAALARIRPGNPPVAERFEVYIQGMELANGFHELLDPNEQLHRFQQDLETRKQRGLPSVPIDTLFIKALEQGLPPCAGVALGLDRLLMIILGVNSIDKVLTFPVEIA